MRPGVRSRSIVRSSPTSGEARRKASNPLLYFFTARLHDNILSIGNVTGIQHDQGCQSSIGIAGETSPSPLPAPGWELLGLDETLQKRGAWNFIRAEPLQMRIGDLTVDQLKLPLVELLG